jgi:acyl-CoA-dependent ceramide synthase
VQSFTTPFFQMSYYQPETGLYTQGRDDIYFVISAVIAFTAVRAIFIEWILRPLAKATGLKKKASLRFAEQAWLVVYDTTYWSYGVVRTFFLSTIFCGTKLTSAVSLEKLGLLARPWSDLD